MERDLFTERFCPDVAPLGEGVKRVQAHGKGLHCYLDVMPFEPQAYDQWLMMTFVLNGAETGVIKIDREVAEIFFTECEQARALLK